MAPPLLRVLLPNLHHLQLHHHLYLRAHLLSQDARGEGAQLPGHHRQRSGHQRGARGQDQGRARREQVRHRGAEAGGAQGDLERVGQQVQGGRGRGGREGDGGGKHIQRGHCCRKV